MPEPTMFLERCNAGTLRPGDWVCWTEEDGFGVGYVEYIELVHGDVWVWTRPIIKNFPPPNDWTDMPRLDPIFGIRASQVWAIKRNEGDR